MSARTVLHRETDTRRVVFVHVLPRVPVCQQLWSCFWRRMGYSREIKVRCLSCLFIMKQYSCKRTDKSNDVTKGRVKAAVASAISHFNQGTSHLTQVMKRLQSAPSTHLSTYQQSQDRNRCLQADQAAQPEAKRHRLQKSRSKKAKQANHEQREGETCGPGMLWETVFMLETQGRLLAL